MCSFMPANKNAHPRKWGQADEAGRKSGLGEDCVKGNGDLLIANREAAGVVRIITDRVVNAKADIVCGDIFGLLQLFV